MAKPMRKISYTLLLVVLLSLLPLLAQGQADDRHAELTDPALTIDPAWAEPGTGPGVSSAYTEFQLVIENVVDGRIYALKTDTETGKVREKLLGRVLAPVMHISPDGFTAAGWGETGTVCATAVNAIHIKTDHNYETGRATLFSLLPVEFAGFDPTDYYSYFNETASLVTDIHAGHGIFGGLYSPLVNSPLHVIKAGDESGKVLPLPDGYMPAVGDTLVISVKRRVHNPEYIEFENRFGGLIWLKELGDEPYPIGQVLKPVQGVGRFLGTQYAGIGRIRANHPGVIDISTSPEGIVGGFQIIPRDHAMSSELSYVRLKTQWMVVGPLDALDASWEGTAPLFSEYLYPAYVPWDEPGEDAADILLGKFRVAGRYADSSDPASYEDLRESVYLDWDALKNLTHLRIVFPREGV